MRVSELEHLCYGFPVRPNRCLGAVLWQFLFECHSWSTRTDGCSSSRPKNKEFWRLLTPGTAGLLVKDQEQIPRSLWCHRLILPKTLSKKKSYGNRIVLCLSIAEYQILSGKHFLFSGPESRKIWCLKKVQYLQKKYHCQWTLLQGKQPKWIFHNFGDFLQPPEFVPTSRERVVPTEWQVRSVLGDWKSKAKVSSIQAPLYRQFALISDFLDLANLSMRERKRHWPRIGSRTDQKDWSFRTWCWPLWQARLCAVFQRLWLQMFSTLLKMRVIGLRETNDPSRESIGNCKGFFSAYGSPSTSFSAAYAVWVLYNSPGHSRRQIWHLCCQRWIHCLGILLENPFKTNWREGLTCSPIQFLQYRILSARVDIGCVPERKFETSAPADYTWKRRRIQY